MMSENNGLNCFTTITKNSTEVEELKKEVDDYFQLYNCIDGNIDALWNINRYGKWYRVVFFPDAEFCRKAKSDSVKYGKPSCIKNMVIHKFDKSPTKRQNIGVNQTTPTSKKLRLSSNINIRILNALRNFGKTERQKIWDEKMTSSRWSRQFAAILVLPVDVYQRIRKGTWDQFPEKILDEYAKFAIPTSYTENFDHFSENGRKVLHAEAKLMGNPVRDPPLLAVPYERSWLMRIINKHEMDQWKSGKAMPNEKYKLFLYSEIRICGACREAIYQSIFMNLVKNDRIDDNDNTKPVIGHDFGNEEELTENGSTINEEEKVIFISPSTSAGIQSVSPAVQNSIRADMRKRADPVKANLSKAMRYVQKASLFEDAV